MFKRSCQYQSQQKFLKMRQASTSRIQLIILDERTDTSYVDSSQSHIPTGGGRVSFTVPVDPMHEEALSILKKLQIIEKDVNSSEFCTRGEFARWFVKLCSKLEGKDAQDHTESNNFLFI